MTSDAMNEAVASGAAVEQRRQVVLRMANLLVGFGRRAILPPIDLEVRRGDLLGVIGRNGAGKTTMFRTLLGLHPAVGGSIERSSRTVVGYVPQRLGLDALVPTRAFDLIVEGTEHGYSFLRPARSKEAKANVERAIEATGSAAFVRRRYRDLSEGQKQRILLARAIAGGAELLVLDEPTSAMDLVAEQEVVEVLLQLRQRFSIAILLVSHHLGLLVSMADRLLFLDADDSIALSGTVAEVTAEPAFIERYGAVLGHRRAFHTNEPLRDRT